MTEDKQTRAKAALDALNDFCESGPEMTWEDGANMLVLHRHTLREALTAMAADVPTTWQNPDVVEKTLADLSQPSDLKQVPMHTAYSLDGYVLMPKEPINKLGSLIPCVTGGTFENDPPDAIIDAAYRSLSAAPQVNAADVPTQTELTNQALITAAKSLNNWMFLEVGMDPYTKPQVIAETKIALDMIRKLLGIYDVI